MGLTPAYVPAGTTLTTSAVVMPPAFYDTLRRDYDWSQQALGRADGQQAASDSTNATLQRALALSRTETRAAQRGEQQSLAEKHAALVELEKCQRRPLRPPILLDGRLYEGAGAAALALLLLNFITAHR